MPHVSIVVPVYNAAECLRELHRRLATQVGAVTEDYELVLVEDGGSDGSWEIIQELARSDTRVRGYQLSRNFGQHMAITAGLDVCDGDWVVVMDCDLQNRPEDVPLLYAAAQQGYDVVVAARAERHDGALRRMATAVFYRLFTYLTDLPYDGAVGNFRIMRRDVVVATRQLRERARFVGGVVHWVGYRTGRVTVPHDARFAGRSSYGFRKLAGLALDMILGYSDKPLRITVHIGALIAGLAFAYGAYTFTRAAVYGIAVTGWASLIVSLYFLSGMLMCVVGMVGIYLSRIFEEVKHRPLYLIRETTPRRESRESARGPV